MIKLELYYKVPVIITINLDERRLPSSSNVFCTMLWRIIGFLSLLLTNNFGPFGMLKEA